MIPKDSNHIDQSPTDLSFVYKNYLVYGILAAIGCGTFCGLTGIVKSEYRLDQIQEAIICSLGLAPIGFFVGAIIEFVIYLRSKSDDSR